MIADSVRTHGLTQITDGTESLHVPDNATTAPHLGSHKDIVSLSHSNSDGSLLTSGTRLETSSQVNMHEKNALKGNAVLQYSFPFDSADTARLKSPIDTLADLKSKTSRQVTKREKKALLNSSINQYNLTLYG